MEIRAEINARLTVELLVNTVQYSGSLSDTPHIGSMGADWSFNETDVRSTLPTLRTA
jgi:hypothetical protein